ncbi:MAG TPA: hypothetical protein VM012_13320, partial [Flavitalea sp.]|nr:hypothetical protein [Flavitalea sp.]
KILETVKRIPIQDLTGKEMHLLANPEENCVTNHFLEWQFLRFFTSYSMAFNKVQCRRGNLFHKPFKRILIGQEDQFTGTLLYIHMNPVKHGVVTCANEYRWSSLREYLTGEKYVADIDFAIEWMGGRDKFLEMHKSAEFSMNLMKGEAFLRGEAF